MGPATRKLNKHFKFAFFIFDIEKSPSHNGLQLSYNGRYQYRWKCFDIFSYFKQIFLSIIYTITFANVNTDIPFLKFRLSFFFPPSPNNNLCWDNIIFGKLNIWNKHEFITNRLHNKPPRRNRIALLETVTRAGLALVFVYRFPIYMVIRIEVWIMTENQHLLISSIRPVKYLFI